MQKITIITATFNSEKYLQKSIDSIRSQTHKNYEYIVVDGASIDNTIDILKANDDIITQWISEPDRGIYDAWNKGLKIATGKWIMFLGSDDFLESNAVSSYIEFISSNSEAKRSLYISSKLHLIDKEGKPIRILGKPWIWEEFRRFNLLAHPGSLHNSELFKIYGYFDINFSICGDYELLLRPKSQLNALFLDQVTTRMTYGGASSSKKNFLQHYLAVTKTAHTNTYVAYKDYLIQIFKLYIRNTFINLKLYKISKAFLYNL